MAWYEHLTLWVGLTLVMVGPAFLLLLLRRWLRRWWAAALCVILISPPVAFFAVGGVAWALTYHRVVVRGDTSVPDDTGRTVSEYLGFTFAVCGAYGVMFAGTGFGLSLPVVGLWRLAHPGSFRRFTRFGRPDAEPGAAADGGGM